MGIKPKFIVAEDVVSQSFDQYAIVMLSDVGHWVDHYEDLEQWCQDNNCAIQGMTVNVPDAITLTAFCLRWS